jgi:hypothetical protein
MRLSVMVAALLLIGCANPYEKAYRGAPDGKAHPGYVYPARPIEIYESGDLRRDALDLMRRGYVMIGQSSFAADVGSASTSRLKEHAQKLGAHIVLLKSQYRGTRSGVVPVYTPTSSTSVTSSSVSAYGRGGPASAYGTSVTTTSGGTTNFIPYSIDTAQYLAAYYIKINHRFGALVRPLDDAERQALQSNTGLVVTAVVEHSPAFVGDILPGDIILSLGGHSVATWQTLEMAIDRSKGRTADVAIRRGTNTLTKQIPILNVY